MQLAITVITPDPRIFVREHNRAVREANVEAARYHHEQHMPDHFKMVGYTKYGIAKRSAGYNKRKQRKYNHVLPLVYTGRTRQVVLSQRQIRATPKAARLIMRAPLQGGTGRIRWRAGMSKKQVNSAVEMLKRVSELEAVSADEVATLATMRGRYYVDSVNKGIAAGGRVRKRAGR